MKFLLTFALCLLPIKAQTTMLRTAVTATGQATVSVAPDQVKVDAIVVSQGTTAQDAAAQNATRSAALVAALQKLLGPSADIKTQNYYLYPNYKYSNDGTPPVILGYSASITVEVTLGTISQTGAVIDTAAASGATSIGSLFFSLKDTEPPRLQALKLATAQAKSHADAMAAGIGHTTGAILAIQEGAYISPGPIYTGIAAGPGAASNTQISPGLIQVQSTVTLQVALN